MSRSTVRRDGSGRLAPRVSGAGLGAVEHRMDVRSIVIVGCLVAVATIATAQPGQVRPGEIDRPIAGQMPARGGSRPAETARGTSILRGFVVSAETGSPVRRAQVRATGQGVPSRLATTDEQGRFEIRELPAGRYTLSASKGGLVSLQYGQRRPGESGTPIELGDGQLVEKIVIGLPRGSVISGRITDEFGEPVANAVVSTMRYGYVGGVRRLMPIGGQNARDTTDDLGQFRLFGLTPGEYVVSAVLRAGGTEVTDPAGEPSGYAPTYYPGTANVNEAQRVTVAVGQEQTSVIFALIATRLVRVSGTAISSQGTPVMTGMVTLVPAAARPGGGMLQTFSGRVDGSGQFRIANVPPGRYVAQLRSPARGGRGGFGGIGEFGRQEITVGGDDLDGLVLVTGPGARVTGTVTTDNGAPPSIRPQQVQISARPVEPDQTSRDMAGSTRVSDEWTFELTNLYDPRLIRASAPNGWALKSVLLNGQDITDAPLDVSPGQTVSGVQVVLTDRLTQVSGRVTDARGAAITDVTVVVFPVEAERWTYQSRFVRTARPDLDGRYEMTGLPAHDGYRIIAVQGLEDGQAGDPQFLSSVRDQAAAFSLNDGETRALDLRFGR